MAPICKNSDAGNSDMSKKKSHEAITLNERVNVLDSPEKKKKLYAEAAKIYSKNESSFHEILK